jgi:hypothetical protein
MKDSTSNLVDIQPLIKKTTIHLSRKFCELAERYYSRGEKISLRRNLLPPMDLSIFRKSTVKNVFDVGEEHPLLHPCSIVKLLIEI